jgi:hypothetical protein
MPRSGARLARCGLVLGEERDPMSTGMALPPARVFPFSSLVSRTLAGQVGFFFLTSAWLQAGVLLLREVNCNACCWWLFGVGAIAA